MAKKVYAIKEGYDSINNKKIENRIVDTWAECLSYVKGVKGAKYKSFENIESAKEYLSDTKKLLKKGEDSYPEDCLHVYVDGSYNIATEKFSYGLVAVRNDVVEYIENGVAEDSSQKQLRQIAGELLGAKKAIVYALGLMEKKLVIFHDYEGIFHHAVGTWERKDESSKKYYEFMNSAVENNNLDLHFVKIDSHTGDIYNEIADCFAKLAAGMAMTGAVDKWLLTNKLYVLDDKNRTEILKIIEENRTDNVVVKKNQEVLIKEDDINSNVYSAIDKLKLLSNKNEKEMYEYICSLNTDIKEKIIIELIKKYQ